MIPAEQIEKVEFMLSTPARYHVRGASLNITTKRHKGNKHFQGQVQGGYTVNTQRVKRKEIFCIPIIN